MLVICGSDGVWPQHTKYMISGEWLFSFESPCFLLNFVLSSVSLSSSFGTNLVAFNKNDRGARLIAVVNTLCRLVTKCAGLLVGNESLSAAPGFQVTVPEQATANRPLSSWIMHTQHHHVFSGVMKSWSVQRVSNKEILWIPYSFALLSNSVEVRI